MRFLISCILVSMAKTRIVNHRDFLCKFMPNLQKTVHEDKAAVDRAISKFRQSPDGELQTFAQSLESNVFIIRHLAPLTLLSLLALSSIIYLWMTAQQQFRTIAERREALEQEESNQEEARTPNHDETTSEPIPTPTPTVNPFYQDRFPKRVCGDPLPTNPSIYPVRFYPVFASYSEPNLARITSQYCQDALGPITRDNRVRAIQVGSFISQERAQLFEQFMEERLPQIQWDIGEPNIIESPPQR